MLDLYPVADGAVTAVGTGPILPEREGPGKVLGESFCVGLTA